MSRKIDFLSWGGQNFCNFIEPVEMKVDTGKVTLITGPNGAGETTLFEILSYALYGITSKGLKGEDVLNERTLQNCSAWANFEISGEKYRVERYVKHKKFKNNVILYKSEQEIKVGANEVKAEIDRIFMPYKLFMNILFFSQKVKSFFTELPDGDQKEIFRKVLGLDDYLLYHKEITKRFDLAEIEVNKVKNNQIISTKLIEDCISNIDKLKELKKNFYIQKEKDIHHILSLKEVQYSKLKELENNLSLFSEIQIRKDLEIISRKISEIQLKHELVNRESQNEINEISSKKATKRAELETEKSRREKAEVEKVNAARNSLTEKFNELKLSVNKEISSCNEKVSSIQSKIDSSLVMKPVHQKEIKEIRENVIDKQICYTCHQEISGEIKAELKSRIKDLESQILLIDQ
jgi:DNA repair exonuclease SbcCD ATPase subunit